MADWEVRWRPAAETDLRRHAAFIAEDNVDAVVGLIDAAEVAVERLAEYPFACDEVPVSRAELGGIRRLILPHISATWSSTALLKSSS